MKLTDLNPKWWPHTAAGLAQALAVEFDCPGCVGTERAHRIWANFARGKKGWTEQGTGFEDLTFVDAPTGSRSVRVLGIPCHSHFNLTNGVIDHYGDSRSP